MTYVTLHTDLSRDFPLVLAAFLFWKFYKKTRFLSLDDIDIEGALREADEDKRY